MIGIYISFVLAFMLMVLSFSYATLVLPGDWYKEKLPLIQLILFALAFFLALFGYFLSGKLSLELANSNSLFQQEFLGILLILHTVFFFGSIYKYYRYRLSIRDGVLTVFELSGDEYSVEKEFHLMLDEKYYMANVKAYIKHQDSIIMLAGSVPEAGGRLRIYCNKIKDNLYECYAFTELDKKVSVKKAFYDFTTVCLLLTAFSLPILLVHMDIVKNNGGNPADYGDLFTALLMFIFGVPTSRIFKGAKGIMAKILYIVCILVILSSLFYFYRSAKLLLGIF